MAKDFNANINLHKNSLLDSKIDPQISLPTTNLYEGRIITHKGKVYIYYNGAWLSLSDLAILAEKAELAEDLVGRPEVYHEEFTFQATANDESVKDGLAIVKSIKGNTVVLNQYTPLSSNHKSPGIISASSFRVSYENETTTLCFKNNSNSVYFLFIMLDVANWNKEYIIGHKYYLYYDIKNSSETSVGLRVKGNGYADTMIAPANMNDYKKYSYIVEVSVSNSMMAVCSVNPIIPAYYEGQCIYIREAKCIDLTQMFGEGNEPTSVEEFERLYPNLPKEYNEGSLLNLNADSIISIGFNAYNGEYAKVLGGMQYYLGDNITSLAFKENLEDEGEVIEIPSDNLYTPTTNGYLFATGSDICINLSHTGYRNGEYEPYKYSITKLPIKEYFTDGMKSIGEIKDEIVWNKVLERYTAIKRIASRAYQAGDEDLADVRTDKTKTIYELAEPIESIVDDYALIEYEVSDFGTEEILSDKPTTPIIAEIQYGFNAADVIRNNLFNIKDLFKLLLTKLSLTGGTMSGAIDMSTNPFIKAGFEYVEELPTKYNFIGRQVFFNNNPYWWTGKEWITFPENSGGGEPTGDYWNLLEANPETDYSVVEIKNRLDSVFPLLYENYGTYLNSRNIYVDLSKYEDSYSYIMDLFGDIKEVPIGVRYHIFVGGYNNNLKIDFPLEYSTNWSFTHTPGFDGYTSELYCIPYSKAIKIEFIKLSDSFVWVDVENYGGMPGYSTATATNSESTNNIVSYCNNNNVEINYDKETGNAIFNLVDILSSITTKLK
jgi:hypothetical protein